MSVSPLSDNSVRVLQVDSVNSMTWLITSLAVLANSFDGMHCMVGVVILGVGDPTAAWFGRFYGKHRLSNGKSLEGLLGFVIVSILACVVYFNVYHPTMGTTLMWQCATLASIAGGLAELMTSMVTEQVDDNFTVPVAAALALWFFLGNDFMPKTYRF